MAVNGSVILIAVNTGTILVPVYTVLPCQKTAEYNLSVGTIDTSCKDSADETNLPGSRSRTIAVEANLSAWPDIVTSPVAVEEVVRKAAETGLQIKGAVMVSATNVETFTASITSFAVAAPREDVTTLSLELAISGAMTPAP